MTRRHVDELTDLAGTWSQISAAGLTHLQRLVDRISDLPTAFVGSGGMSAVARLACDLHQERASTLAIAATPLQATAGSLSRARAVVLMSARAKHPDVLITARAAHLSRVGHVALVTHRNHNELPVNLRQYLDEVVTLPSYSGDGFLATNSVLAFSTALVRAHGTQLLDPLPWISRPFEKPTGWDADRWLVAYGPEGRAAAEDVEARLAETGLRGVQLADFRNFAHGRHVGLERHSGKTLVMALFGPESRDLARRTLDLVPDRINKLMIETHLPFPVGTLDLLSGTMRVVGQRAVDDGFEIARPGVAEWGRRLYHLNWAPNAPRLDSEKRPPNGGRDPARSRPARLKLRAAGEQDGNLELGAVYELALQSWLRRRASETIGGLVLDYDGTCCETDGRFDLPPLDVRSSINRLLDAGVSIGFASGRGRSLVHGDEGLRKWIPQAHWSNVIVGLYNGGLLQDLSSDVPDQEGCAADLADIADLVETYAPTFHWNVRRRLNQVTVEAARLGPLADILRSLLARRHTGIVKLLVSAHSADIVPSSTSKQVVLHRMSDLLSSAGRGHTQIMAIGDSGAEGGNDFELLAAVPASLTVESCSPDPDRCWNLSQEGERGPALLVQYLDAIRVLAPAYGRFEWKS